MHVDRRQFIRMTAVGLFTAVLAPDELLAGTRAARRLRRSRGLPRRNRHRTAGPQPSVGPEGAIVVKAPTDGTDVTQIILTAIAAAPDGATLFFPPGRYRCEGSLKVTDRVGLTFTGPATFYATERGKLDNQGNSQRRHWWFVRCRDITVKDIRVESINTKADQRPGFGSYLWNHEFEHGFAFHECAGIVVEDCSTYGTYGDGLYLGNEAPTTNVRVSGLVVEYNGRQGVALSNCEGVLLENVQIRNTRRAGFDLEPALSSWRVRDVEIRNSSINGYHVAFAAGGDGDVSGIHIHHNTVAGPGVPWVHVGATDGTRRRNWRIEDNVIQDWLGSPEPAFRFVNVDDIAIRRNVCHIASQQSRLPIRFTDCRGTLEVTNNDFRAANRVYEAKGKTSPVISAGNRLSA